MRILIVEDESRLALALQKILADAGYESELAADGHQALQEALRTAYDLILLDVMLPGKDGLAVASELRQLRVVTPILMLTAKDSIQDKVLGLDAGADDYMTKPFDNDELLARIRALTRRQPVPAPPEYSFGDLVYRSGSANLCCGAKTVRLNYKEAEIIKLLMSFPQFILSKDELIAKVWGYDSDTPENNVEAYISFLRKKLNFLGSAVSIIAIKKQGYKLEMPEC